MEFAEEVGLGLVGPEDEEAGDGLGEVGVDGGAGGGFEAFEGGGEREEGEGDVEGEGEDDGLCVFVCGGCWDGGCASCVAMLLHSRGRAPWAGW